MNVIDLIDYIVVEDQLRNVDANIVILFNKQFSSTTRALLRSPTTILVVGSRPLLTFDFHHHHILASPAAILVAKSQRLNRSRLLPGHHVYRRVIIRIQRPDGAGEAYFCRGHGKPCDFLNVQVVADKTGRIRHTITSLSGSTHDKSAAVWSVYFRHFLDTLPAKYVVLGDAAYRHLYLRVITPVVQRQQLNVDQHAYNNACTHIRQIVERSIGTTERKWRIQQLKENRITAKKGITFAAPCTITAAMLHNRFTNFLQ